MMIPTDEQSFRKLFNESREEFRFQYEVNRPLASLLFMFCLSMIGGTFFLTSKAELSESMSLLAWAAAIGVSIGILMVLFTWRTIARRSAILFSDDALLWLDKSIVTHVMWTELDTESFAHALTGARTAQGVMTFQTGDGPKMLPIFTPFMRIDYSRFTLGILVRLKEAEENEA
jgi:hypothetical protein